MGAKGRLKPKYRPALRTPPILKPATNSHETESNGSRRRSLSLVARVLFDRRNRFRISLLPERNASLPEEVTVTGPNEKELWISSQDKWYEGIVPPNLGTILREGGNWEACQQDGAKVNWVVSGREIYVLARCETVSGFVSMPRLILGEEHVVLCTQSQENAVRQSLMEAGCANTNVLDSASGAPAGWILFTSVHPTIAIHHDDSAGILNVLRPVHDVEVVFRGGIRLERSSWLLGHPPQIHVRGMKDGEQAVIIDGSPASPNACAGLFSSRLGCDWKPQCLLWWSFAILRGS